VPVPTEKHDPAQNVEAAWPNATSVPASSIPAAEASGAPEEHEAAGADQR
jgi:hypothetical protein